MNMRTMMTTLKMDKRKKSLKERHMNMSTHQTGKTTQVKTSSEINTKLTKKTLPYKITAQKN